MLKRRKLKKTDYRQRLKLLKSGKIRLVVRRKHNNMHIQFVKYGFNGDHTLVEEISRNLAKHGWKAHCGSIPASYLTGFLAGKKALHRDIKECVVDIGLHATNSIALYAAVKGVTDAGVDVPLGFALPEDKIKGSHIAEYAKLLKKDSKKYSKQFSNYAKIRFDPESIVQNFEEVKANIMKSFTEKRKVEAE